MNRPTSSASVPLDRATSPVVDGDVHEHLSALVDGELDAPGLARLWREDGEVVCATWARYQLIGETLRGAAPAAAATDSARVAAIMQRVRAEHAATAPSLRPMPSESASATLAVSRSAEAANDAVFRWKMVAGFASLAAVVAVAWNMAGSGDLGGAAGPQLAQAPVQTAPAPSAAVASATAVPVPPVVVAGEQGPILRDARLEELMAAHRQAGGMSALQMPAGFLRNAAFELPDGQR